MSRQWAIPEPTRPQAAPEGPQERERRAEVARCEAYPVMGMPGMVDVRLRASTWAWIKEVLRCAR